MFQFIFFSDSVYAIFLTCKDKKQSFNNDSSSLENIVTQMQNMILIFFIFFSLEDGDY